jgi:hypothetical protein
MLDHILWAKVETCVISHYMFRCYHHFSACRRDHMVVGFTTTYAISA